MVDALVIAAAAGVGGTGAGGMVAALFRKNSAKGVSLLMSFAAGIMTGVVCFDLLAEAMTKAAAAGSHGMVVAAGTLTGYGVIGLLNHWVDRRWDDAEICQKVWAEEKGTAANWRELRIAGVILAAAIALHNMPEGVAIGTSFALVDSGLSREGILMAAVIGLHNIPEGMAVAAPLIAGGMAPQKAAAVTAASGAPTVLGAFVGLCLGEIGPCALALSLSFAAGAMLYVVFGELLPEALELWNSKKPAFAATVGLIVGLLIAYA